MRTAPRLEQLRESERPKLLARANRLAGQLSSPDVDPVAAGWLDLHDAIWWVALYGELAGAASFLDACRELLARRLVNCQHPCKSLEEAYSCFTCYLGLVLVRELSDRGSGDRAALDPALSFLDMCVAFPDEEDASSRTPSTLTISGVSALAVLWDRALPRGLVGAAISRTVSPQFAQLHQALSDLIAVRGPDMCRPVRSAYGASITIEGYRAGLIHGLQLQTVLVLSAVGRGGDVWVGATKMFDSAEGR